MREVPGSSQRIPNQRDTSSMPASVIARTLPTANLEEPLRGRRKYALMAYDIDLERDMDRGLDRYRITLAEGFDATEAHELGDWMTAAAQNPTAVFTIDLAGASRTRRPVRTL